MIKLPFMKKKSVEELLHQQEIDFLSSIPFLRKLNKKNILLLYNIMIVRNYEKGEQIFRQGDPGNGLYIVYKGEVEVFKEFDDMTCIKVNTLSEGEFFGETTLLKESPRTATILAGCKSILFGLFQPELVDLIDSETKLGRDFFFGLSVTLSERLLKADEKFKKVQNET